MINDAVNYLKRSNDGPGRNDGEMRNDNQRRNYYGRQNDNLDRDYLRHIAFTTLRVLDEGEYFPPGQDGPYDLKEKIEWAEDNTRYYGPDAGVNGEILESEFIKINEEGGDEGKEEKEEERNKDGNTGEDEEANDASHLSEKKQGENESGKASASNPHDDDSTGLKDQTRVQATINNAQTTIYIGEYSTLVGARRVHLALARDADPSVNMKVGVLNFASAKKPGGGFINGSQAQVRFLYFLTSLI